MRQEFPHLREWCEDYFWAPSCYCGSVGWGWEVVKKCIFHCAGGEKAI
ncbi:MAG: hypothetical protein O8C56_01560 [Candidatus Methanoperedens sp.]|nr:hypothetical protein [Candidatus Methanoperedens sp.]